MFTALNVPFTLLNCVLYTLPFQAANATSNIRQKWNCWSFFKDMISLTSHCWFWCLDVITSIVSYSFYNNELLLCFCFLPWSNNSLELSKSLHILCRGDKIKMIAVTKRIPQNTQTALKCCWWDLKENCQTSLTSHTISGGNLRRIASTKLWYLTPYLEVFLPERAAFFHKQSSVNSSSQLSHSDQWKTEESYV